MQRQPASFEAFAGACAVVTGVGGFLYSVAFVVIARSAPDLGLSISWLLLLGGGLLTVAALTAVYRRLRDVDPGFALLGFLLGFAGALGAAAHGAYEVALVFHPTTRNPDLPNVLDPRGFLTFGAAGLAVLVLSWLMTRGGGFPRGLANLGYLSGVLLVLIYLGRLVVFDASSLLILVPAGLEGFIVNPIWYVWLGLALWRGGRA